MINSTTSICLDLGLILEEELKEGGNHMRVFQDALNQSDHEYTKMVLSTEDEVLKTLETSVFEITIEGKKAKRTTLLPGYCVHLARVFVSNYWWRALSLLVECETFCLSLIPDLLDNAISNNALDLILVCARHMRDIRDGHIVKILKYLINEKEDKRLLRKVRDMIHLKELEEDQALSYLLDIVLSLKRENLFMQNNLKSLNINEIKVLLGHLLAWLHAYINTTDVNQTPENMGPRIETVSFENVLSWISMIIDVHFSVLVFSGDTFPLVKRIHNLMGKELQFQQKLLVVEGYFTQKKIEGQRNVKITNASGNISDLYRIEILE